MQTDSYFSFKGFTSDVLQGNAVFEYELYDNGRLHKFADTLKFTPPARSREIIQNSGSLNRILTQLHLALGISYWKATCPREIRTPAYTLTKYQSQFWNTLYTKGLGEFFYKNSIDYRGILQFPFGDADSQVPASSPGSDRSLVLLGGGKDSIVAGELLKKSGKDFKLFAVNPNDIHEKTAHIMGKDLITVSRNIDPQLFELNKHSGIYNGHIPISSIFAFLGLFAAYIYNYSRVITSNEESANFGNVLYLGEEINHQWSKSLEFEQLFRAYCKEFVTPDIEYFSLLRTKSEFQITKIFSQYPAYFQHFTSCNKAFRIVNERPVGNWCGSCPKCAFVYLLLAAYLSKSQLYAIFHKNVFEDETLLPMYKELCGLEGFKPFECVGTPTETILAFRKVFERNDYAQDSIVQLLRVAVSSQHVSTVSPVANEFLSKPNCIPVEFMDSI